MANTSFRKITTAFAVLAVFATASANDWSAQAKIADAKKVLAPISTPSKVQPKVQTAVDAILAKWQEDNGYRTYSFPSAEVPNLPKTVDLNGATFRVMKKSEGNGKHRVYLAK